MINNNKAFKKIMNYNKVEYKIYKRVDLKTYKKVDFKNLITNRT